MALSTTRITIYENLYSETAYPINLGDVLERIKTGSKSAETVRQVRELGSKDEQKEVKNKLPCIVFAGYIPTGKRLDTRITEFSNLAILDYDNLTPVEYADKKRYFVSQSYTVAAFLSPSGNGLKVVVRIKDGSKHRDYYKAILHEFIGLDPTNINPSRV